jgi:hypothetical protein
MYPDHNAAIADILKLNEALTAEQLESIVIALFLPLIGIFEQLGT